MNKMMIFSVSGVDVEGNFPDGKPTDYIVLIGKSAPTASVHVYDAGGRDCCRLLGCPCPMEMMTGYPIPDNEFTHGDYQIKASSGGAGGKTGTLNVGSGRGQGDLRGKRDQ